MYDSSIYIYVTLWINVWGLMYHRRKTVKERLRWNLILNDMTDNCHATSMLQFSN